MNEVFTPEASALSGVEKKKSRTIKKPKTNVIASGNILLVDIAIVQLTIAEDPTELKNVLA
jgi:hypothetical protein